MTSPVERISGPRTVSTTRPSVVRNRLKGRTASLTAIGSSGSVTAASASGSWAERLSEAIVSHVMMRAAALASCTPEAFETKGTVREALGLASMT